MEPPYLQDMLSLINGNPNFTGRKSECDEIAGLLASQLIYLQDRVNLGITRVWITFSCHCSWSCSTVASSLRDYMPVYFIALRGFHSKVDLTLKLLYFVRQFATKDEPSDQYLALDDEPWMLIF